MQIVSRPNCLCWWPFTFLRYLSTKSSLSKKLRSFFIYLFLFYFDLFFEHQWASQSNASTHILIVNRFISPTGFVWSHTDFIRRYNKSRTKELTFIHLQNDNGKIPFLLWCEQPKSPQNRVYLKPRIRNRAEKDPPGGEGVVGTAIYGLYRYSETCIKQTPY